MGRYARNNTTSSYRSLDIRYLRRQDLLRPRGWFTLTWSRNGEVMSSIRILAEFDRVVLSYRHQTYGGDWTPREYPVFLDTTLATTAAKGAGLFALEAAAVAE